MPEYTIDSTGVPAVVPEKVASDRRRTKLARKPTGCIICYLVFGNSSSSIHTNSGKCCRSQNTLIYHVVGPVLLLSHATMQATGVEPG